MSVSGELTAVRNSNYTYYFRMDLIVRASFVTPVSVFVAGHHSTHQVTVVYHHNHYYDSHQG